MNNIYYDKLLAEENVILSREDENSIRALQEGRVGEFYVKYDNENARICWIFHFIKDMSFEDFIFGNLEDYSLCDADGRLFTYTEPGESVDTTYIYATIPNTSPLYDPADGSLIYPDTQIIDGHMYQVDPHVDPILE